MKICFICPEYPPGPQGGVGTFTQIMSRALVRGGHQVRVAGVYPHDYKAAAYEEDEGVQVWRIHEPISRLGWVAARYRLYRLIKNWVRARECDLVECPDAYGWIAGWPRLSVPLVLRAHGSLTYYAHELDQPVNPTGHRLEMWAYRRADSWVAVSKHAAQLTRKLFKLGFGPDAVLYNPVDAPSRVPQFSTRNICKVVFTGTLTSKKGIISLFRAWPLVKNNFRDAELHVYGKDGASPDGRGTMRDYLLKSLPNAMHKSTKFHGHVAREELITALGRARAAVFPSYTETFGLGPAEAMACACPTIYTKLTCGPEIIRDGVDGLLVDPDQPDQIAAAILKLLVENETASYLSKAGRKRAVQCFGLDQIVAANDAFFSRTIQEFPRSRV